MRKSLFIIKLAFVSASVCGMITNGNSDKSGFSNRVIQGSPVPQAVGNSRQPFGRSGRLQINQAIEQSFQEASTSSNTEEKSLEYFLKQNTENEKSVLRRTDPEKLEKIENYLSKRKSGRTYSHDLLEEVLVHYCLHQETLVAEIAENYGIDYSALRSYISKAKISKIPFHKLTEEQINRALEKRREKNVLIEAAETNNMHPVTLWRKSKEQGEDPLKIRVDREQILELYKNGKTFKDFYKLITSGENNAKKKLAEVISEKMTDSQKEQLVNENMDIIKDFREKLLTDKGRLDKYKYREIQVGDLCTRKFGECEDYLIRNIAVKLGYDLSKLPIEWDIEYNNNKDVPDYMKQLVIKEFNKGLLTLNGIAKKYKIRTIKSILDGRYKGLIQRRRAKSNSYKYIDISKVTKKRIQSEYGYAPTCATILKRCLNQYNKLNLDQKKLFKSILDSDIRKMPSDEYLDEIKSLKYGDNRANEKFRKLLLILCNREDEVKMIRSSINRLKQQLEVWKKLAENDQTN